MARLSSIADGAAHAAAKSRLLHAKLSPRLSSPRPLSRTRIVERIQAAEGAKLVLVNAAAGFGKTTVMLQYFAQLQQRDTATAWLTVDAADNEVARFFNYIVRAFQLIDPTIRSGLDRNSPKARGNFDDAAIDLANHLSAFTSPFVLFIDDFETITNPSVFDLVRQIIDYLPSQGQVVIGSRNIPKIGLGRLRASGELVEITAPQLCFTPEETASFLRHSRGLALSNEQILRLHQHTDGWAAALWLVSLALKGREDPQQFIDTFDGTDVSITEYLVDDVLSRQPDQVRSFLLRTSVLNELCGSLCDHALERNDSLEMLSYIEHAHLFLAPWDAERHWYRYHPLFRGFLHAQLKSTAPDTVGGLHRRASDWYSKNGRPVAAIEHALSSGDVQHSLSLLAAHAEDLLCKGRARLLARWFDSPTLAGRLQGFPRLTLVYAWALTLLHRGPRAMDLLVQLRVAQSDTGATDETTSCQIDALQAYILVMADCFSEAAARWRDCLGRLSPQEPFTYGMLAASYACCLIAESRFKEARRFLDQANRVHLRIGSTFMVTAVICLEGTIDFAQGRLRSAVARFRAALASTTHDSRRHVSGTAVAVTFLAEALYELNELDEADRLLKLYLPLIKGVAAPDQLISSYAVLARIASSRGSADQAADILTEMESVGHQRSLPRMVATARLERSRSALLRGNVAAAEDYLSIAAERTASIFSNGFVGHASDVDSPELARLRLDVRCGRSKAAIARLNGAIEYAEGLHRYRRALKLNILLAEALHNAGQPDMGMRRLRDALRFAAGEGFVRSFVDEGESVIRLVAEFESAVHSDAGHGAAAGELMAFVRTVLAAGAAARVGPAATEAVPTVGAGATGPLSKREVQVLRLLASGHSNRIIAEKLFVSETTVKAHLRSVNVKLDTHSRTHAVAVARQHGWVA